jgi:hypothetical protein
MCFDRRNTFNQNLQDELTFVEIKKIFLKEANFRLADARGQYEE